MTIFAFPKHVILKRENNIARSKHGQVYEENALVY